MASKTLFLAVSALAGASLVAAQAAPNWQYIPVACESQCSQTIESAYTCQTQYAGDTTNIYGCFCSNYPSDADGCASCLNDNNSAALASLLTSTKTACPQAEQQCFFQCSFDTCPQGDVACACEGSYLANIYNCASCNTANNNAGTTQITDFEALQQSCQAQNYTGASQDFTTKALPVASTEGYMAPTLTATGGGAAATGDASDLGAASGTVSEAAGTTADTAPTTVSGAASRSSTSARATSRASGTSASAGTSASGSGAAAAASSAPANSAGMIGVPALGGLLGLAGAVAALF